MVPQYELSIASMSFALVIVNILREGQDILSIHLCYLEDKFIQNQKVEVLWRRMHMYKCIHKVEKVSLEEKKQICFIFHSLCTWQNIKKNVNHKNNVPASQIDNGLVAFHSKVSLLVLASPCISCMYTSLGNSHQAVDGNRHVVSYLSHLKIDLGDFSL